MILRATPPVFDSRLIVLLNAGETTVPAPVATPEPAPVVPQRTPEQQAQRDQEDEGAKGATAKQLKEALDGLGIKYPDNATKAALLALWTSRP